MDNGEIRNDTLNEQLPSSDDDAPSSEKSEEERGENVENTPEDIHRSAVKKKRIPRELKEFLIRIAATAGVIWLALTFLVGIHMCHSDTCYPMVKDGDLCVTWLPGSPSQGDLIVYKHNGETCFGRVAAVAGDRVEIVGGAVWVNGYIVQTGTVQNGTGSIVEAKSPLTVPEGSVFVLSDNSSDVNDSRLFGTIPLSDYRGSVIFLMRRRGF